MEEIKVGDRITYRYTDVDVISSTIIDDETSLKFYKDHIENGKKELLKIERPTDYEVVYGKKELLTEEEREFLKNAMKFANYGSNDNGNIMYIELNGFFLEFYYSDWACNAIYVDRRKHFKGLENKQKYTLSELGLEE